MTGGLTSPEFNAIVSEFTLIVAVVSIRLGRTTVSIIVLLDDCPVNPGLIVIAVGDGVLVVILAVVDVSIVVAVPLNALPVVNSKLDFVNADDVRISM